MIKSKSTITISTVILLLGLNVLLVHKTFTAEKQNILAEYRSLKKDQHDLILVNDNFESLIDQFVPKTESSTPINGVFFIRSGDCFNCIQETLDVLADLKLKDVNIIFEGEHPNIDRLMTTNQFKQVVRHAWFSDVRDLSPVLSPIFFFLNQKGEVLDMYFPEPKNLTAINAFKEKLIRSLELTYHSTD